MDGMTLVSLAGNIGSLISGVFSVYGITSSRKIEERLTMLKNELSKHATGSEIQHEIADDKYNLLNSIIINTINYGTKQKIRRFAKIAHDVFHSGYLDISRGEKFVYAVNDLSDQEVAFLMIVGKNIETLREDKDKKARITFPNSIGEYQPSIQDAFKQIGIAQSEWLVVLKKLDNLGILQYEDTLVIGGLQYSFSDFGQEFIRYLLRQDELEA